MAFQPPNISITVLDGGLSSGTIEAPDGPMWILGLASSGPLTPFTTSQPTDLKSTFGYGEGVEASLFALNNELRTCTFLRIDPTDATDGAYGTITVEAQGAGFTATGDGTIKPTMLWEPVIDFTVGGTIGTTGIRYRYSLDNGNKFSGERELGTATSITLPNGAGKYNLVGLELTTLVARVADVRTEFLAHTGESPTFHGVVDPNAPYTVATPTNDATVLTACANLLTHATTHVAVIAGTHGAVDTAAQAALGALSAPSTRAEAIAFIEAFVAAFFGDGTTVNSGHTLRTASAVHLAPDTTNVLTSDPAVAGDIVAGDKFYLSTTAQRWHIDQLVAALEVVRDSNAPINGVLEIVGNVNTSAEAQAIEDALDQVATKYRDVAAIGHFRPRNAGESLQAYATAFETAHPLSSRSGRRGRLTLCASAYLPAQLFSGGISVKPISYAVAPRLARTSISTNAISGGNPPAEFGTLKAVLRASDNTTVLSRAVDESFAPVCTPVALWAPLSENNTVKMSRPVTLAEDGSDFSLIHYRRVLDAVRKSSYRVLLPRKGQKVAPKPGTVYIDPNEATRIGDATAKALNSVYRDGGDVDNIRVVVLETSVVSGAGDKVLNVQIFVRPVGYIEDISATLQFEL